MKVSAKKTIPKFLLFSQILLSASGNIYAHGDYSELVTNPFVFGASILTFILFSGVIFIVNKSRTPVIKLTYWKLGLGLSLASGAILFLGMRDHAIAVVFLLLLTSIIPAIIVVTNNELPTIRKIIVFFLSSTIYFVTGGICGLLYLS